MNNSSRRSALRALAALPALAVCRGAIAERFPSQPIKYLLGYAAGGTTDTIARLINPAMAAALGQPVIIEYYPGAGGVIAAQRAVRAIPDGYTILHLSSDFATVTPHLVKIDYDPVTDLEPVAYYGSAVQVLAVKPSLPVNTFAQFVDYARANPGKLSYGSSGTATGNHITTEYLKQAAKIQAVHVPYRGAAPAIQDLMAGVVDFVIDPGLLSAIRSGKVKAIAVVDVSKHPMLPELEYVGATIPEWNPPQWFHYSAVPNKTSLEIRESLASAALQWKSDTAIRNRLAENSIVVGDLSAAQLKSKVRDENQRVGSLIKAVDIKLN